MRPSSKRLAVLLIAASIQGCAGQSTQLPATSKQLENLPRVENSRSSPCWQQKQIAAQNSYLASAIEKKDKPDYKAPCEIEGKKVARSK